MTRQVELSLDIELLGSKDDGFPKLTAILGGLEREAGLSRREDVPVTTLASRAEDGYRRLVVLGPYTEPLDDADSTKSPAALAVRYLDRISTSTYSMRYDIGRVVPFASSERKRAA